MATSSNYRLGSIWLVNFDPSIGAEIRKTRPAMIISGTVFNQRRKVTVLPITSSLQMDDCYLLLYRLNQMLIMV
jgi:mRNA interferase MazF